jgi:hypothetical protein
VTDLAKGQLPIRGLGARHDQQHQTAKAGETASKEAAIFERIVEDNVALRDKLAEFA